MINKKQQKTQQKTQQDIKRYDELFFELGLADLPADEKARRASEIEENIETRVISRILSAMSEEDKKLFDACKTDADIEEFFKKKNIDPAAIAMEEALNFREELIRDAAYIEGRLSALKSNKS